MSAITLLNPRAQRAKAYEALSLNITAAIGLQNYMKGSFGPKGTMKMLVDGGRGITISKDGCVILESSPFRHPTKAMISSACTAQDQSVADGTTSTVLLIAEILKQADIYLCEGVHPRILVNGINKALQITLGFLEKEKRLLEPTEENLLRIAKTALSCKVTSDLVEVLSNICVKSVGAIRQDDKEIDLHMIEILEMPHRTRTDTTLVEGIVMDHGSRHPDMPKMLKNAYILTCNVTLEYERTEENSSFFYKTTEELHTFVESERDLINQRCMKIVKLKRKLCNGTDKSFVVLNQKGIDPLSLEIFAKEGIIALRRAKSRNMERLTLACGGTSMNTVDELDESCLGYAGLVYEEMLEETKYTFVKECKNPKAVTIVVNGPSKHARAQVKDAIRDGLKAVSNIITDKYILDGAASFEISAYKKIMSLLHLVHDKAVLGYEVFAKALLIIPNTLAANSGLDTYETVTKLLTNVQSADGAIGLDINTGEPKLSKDLQIFENYRIKKECLNTSVVVACNLLCVDEILQAGLTSLKHPQL